MKKDILNRNHFHWMKSSKNETISIIFNWRPARIDITFDLSLSKDSIELSIGLWAVLTISIIF